MDPDEESAHWRARVAAAEDPGWAIDGRPRQICAGTMLDQEHLLTCAHAVAHLTGAAQNAPRAALEDTTYVVTLVNLPGMPEQRATVQTWIPVDDHGGGDIAILKLTAPLAEAQGAPLYRSDPAAARTLRTCGFPAGADTGYWVTTEIAGTLGPEGMWVQLASEHITNGFSGAAVMDEDNHVVGLCVTQLQGSPLKNAYMLPVEALAGMHEDLQRWITGPRTADDSYASAARYDPDSREPARRIAEWLARARTGQVAVLLTGEPGSSTAVALSSSVVLADRERARAGRSLSAHLPPDAIPQPGSINLAVDAAGRTTEQVSDRLRERLGLDPDLPGRRHRGRTRTVVISGVDAAADPAGLTESVVLPLIRYAHRWRLRLILGFRDRSPQWQAVQRATTDTAELLRQLAADLAELESIEAGAAELHARLSERIAGLPALPRTAALHRSAVQLLRADTGAEPIAACRRALERDVRALLDVRSRLEAARERRAELRGMLASYHAGAPSDPELEPPYRAAARELWEGRCDLDRAAELVRRYGQAVRGRQVAERDPA